ncbi:NUDIX domain-containing protein [Lacticaseibacillus jixianensis]|uniref:NUDIX domain-containing protein n=1 Tax=Lacticaseibacillus jixianensis TaxID=2486012 RepID=A0ABW4B7Z6_9LACO|nr:NUDIX domain-containing protein [Lacticaseibacillus jixianensis]
MITDKLNEPWDLYDRKFNLVGKQRRKDPVPHGLYHLTVALLVFDGHGRLLVQRRSPHKLHRPGCWDLAAGGSALRGESSAQAAARELHEELGLTADFTQESPVATLWHASWVEVVYQVTFPGLTVAQLVLQKSEVAAVALLPLPAATARLAGSDTDWAAVVQRARHD